MPAPASVSNFNSTCMKYFDEMCRAMEFLARDERTIFLGQAVGCPGTAMSNTLKNVPSDRLLELPAPVNPGIFSALGDRLEYEEVWMGYFSPSFSVPSSPSCRRS